MPIYKLERCLVTTSEEVHQKQELMPIVTIGLPGSSPVFFETTPPRLPMCTRPIADRRTEISNIPLSARRLKPTKRQSPAFDPRNALWQDSNLFSTHANSYLRG